MPAVPPNCSTSADDRNSDAVAAACDSCCSDRNGRLSVIIRTVRGPESRGGVDHQQLADHLACSLRRDLAQQLQCPGSGGPAVVVARETIAADEVGGNGQCGCCETARGNVIQVIVTCDSVETSCNDVKQEISGTDDICCGRRAPQESSTCEKPTQEIRQDRGSKKSRPCSVEIWDLPSGGVKVTVTQAVDTSCNDDERVVTDADNTCCGGRAPQEISTCEKPLRKGSTCKRPKRKNSQQRKPVEPRPCSVEMSNLPPCVDEAPQDDRGLGCMDSRQEACDRWSESGQKERRRPRSSTPKKRSVATRDYDSEPISCVYEPVCDESAVAEAAYQEDCQVSGVQEDELDECQVEAELAVLDKRRAYLLRVLEEYDQPVGCNSNDEGAQRSR